MFRSNGRKPSFFFCYSIASHSFRTPNLLLRNLWLIKFVTGHSWVLSDILATASNPTWTKNTAFPYWEVFKQLFSKINYLAIVACYLREFYFIKTFFIFYSSAKNSWISIFHSHMSLKINFTSKIFFDLFLRIVFEWYNTLCITTHHIVLREVSSKYFPSLV